MPRLAGLLGAAGLAVAGLTLTGGAAEGASVPTLHVSPAPLAVSGTGFGSGERVLVVVTAPPGFLTRRTQASAGGTFQVRFPGVSRTRRILRVRAVGSQGDAALWPPRSFRLQPPTA